MEDKDPGILYSQYYDCKCPGDARSQGISSHDIGLVWNQKDQLTSFPQAIG